MKVFNLEIPEGLRDVFALVQITDDGHVFVVYKHEAVLRQINGQFGDMFGRRTSIPVGRQMRVDVHLAVPMASDKP